MTRIDRRALFTSGAAAALLAATGTSLSATPRSGGQLRLAVPRDGNYLKLAAQGAVFDTLTEIAPDGVLRGELAKGWEASEDGRLWQFILRDDVTFHNKRPMTVTDVAASLKMRAASAIELDEIELTSDHMLSLRLKQANPDLPYLLSNEAFFISPEGQATPELDQAIGTGCYRVERAQEGRHFRATRVQDHYKSGQAGWVETVEVIVIPDPAVRAEALRDGFVDVAVLPQPRGLLKRGDFLYHPSAEDMAIAAARDVGIPRKVGRQLALDDGRIAERWWRV